MSLGTISPSSEREWFNVRNRPGSISISTWGCVAPGVAVVDVVLVVDGHILRSLKNMIFSSSETYFFLLLVVQWVLKKHDFSFLIKVSIFFLSFLESS